VKITVAFLLSLTSSTALAHTHSLNCTGLGKLTPEAGLAVETSIQLDISVTSPVEHWVGSLKTGQGTQYNVTGDERNLSLLMGQSKSGSSVSAQMQFLNDLDGDGTSGMELTGSVIELSGRSQSLDALLTCRNF
jgi:hypothetical protein